MPTDYELIGQDLDSKLTPATPNHVTASLQRASSPERAIAIAKDWPAREYSSATDKKVLASLASLSESMAKMES